jgi:polyphosphate kinase 2 (PPK2 family)
MAHLPAGGEIVIFDRSWYNRAGVEHVMGFCTDEEYKKFLKGCPAFENFLVNNGIILLKYWLDVSEKSAAQAFCCSHRRPHEALEAKPDGLGSASALV